MTLQPPAPKTADGTNSVQVTNLSTLVAMVPGNAETAAASAALPGEGPQPRCSPPSIARAGPPRTGLTGREASLLGYTAADHWHPNSVSTCWLD